MGYIDKKTRKMGGHYTLKWGKRLWLISSYMFSYNVGKIPWKKINISPLLSVKMNHWRGWQNQSRSWKCIEKSELQGSSTPKSTISEGLAALHHQISQDQHAQLRVWRQGWERKLSSQGAAPGRAGDQQNQGLHLKVRGNTRNTRDACRCSKLCWALKYGGKGALNT